jgi:hypothetical protein
VIGVTGHRDLRPEDLERLEAEVDDFLDDLRKRAPRATVTVMCGMAQGADTLVAERALRRRMRVLAVLPMPVELYSADFDAEGHRELERMLADPMVDRLELALPAGLTESAVAAQGPERDRLYAGLAEHIHASSNILLALWDGEVTGLLGGTSDVILRYLSAENGSGAISRVRPLDEESSPPPSLNPAYVYWLPARRQADGAAAGEPLGGAPSAIGEAPERPSFLVGGDGGGVLWQEPRMPEELSLQLAELDELNEQHARLSGDGRPAEADGLLAAAPVAADDPYRDALERIDREYVRADALALHFQRRSDSLFKLSAFTAATMGVVFLLFAKITSFIGFLVIYLALFGLGLLAFRFARRRRWLSRHLTYRALAETMRTRFFLVLAGVHRDVDVGELMGMTGTHRLPGFGLIGGLVKTTEPAASARRDAGADASMIDYVRRAWVADQASYFSAKIGRLAHAQHRMERVKVLMVGIFVAATIALIFAKDPLAGSTIYEFGSGDEEHKEEAVSVKTLLIFIMGALPFLLGVWELQSNKMATKELLWQYRNQADYFGLAEEELSATEDLETRSAIIARLGRKSLVEGYQWAMYRFHREHEPPVAG